MKVSISAIIAVTDIPTRMSVHNLKEGTQRPSLTEAKGVNN